MFDVLSGPEYKTPVAYSFLRKKLPRTVLIRVRSFILFRLWHWPGRQLEPGRQYFWQILAKNYCYYTIISLISACLLINN